MAGTISIAYNSKDRLLPKDNHTAKRAYHHRPKMMEALPNLPLLSPVSMSISSTDKKNYPIWKYLVGIQIGKKLIKSNINNPPQAPNGIILVTSEFIFLTHGKMGFDCLSGKIYWERFLHSYHTEF
ncbi:hypothetical protein O181_019016 [Austropuccinia psidii MF-1]|uniref:Uncharacterized protein n=1 Tax=Austropuccinia psidii MF-1 TaxID=1389203 RepID=A0A9Q3CAP1_9BASI|nr:hypothetical protein [Austropuccinia psidii MF-1]